MNVSKITKEKRGLFDVIDYYTERLERIVMSIGLIVMSGIVFVNVISRYFFDSSLIWSEELARYIVVWVSFVGISSCARYDGHVNVDLLQNKLKGKTKYFQGLIVKIISLAISVYLAYLSIDFTITQFKGGNSSIAIAIPIWLIYLSTAIGFVLTSYVYARKLAAYIADRKEMEK